MLRQDGYAKNRILEELNSEFTEINFTYVYLGEVVHLDTAQLPRYSWYVEQSSSKYLRVYIASDGEFDLSFRDIEGLNFIQGFIDLNGNVIHRGLNLW